MRLFPCKRLQRPWEALSRSMRGKGGEPDAPRRGTAALAVVLAVALMAYCLVVGLAPFLGIVFLPV